MKVVTKAELLKLRQTRVEEAVAAINTRLTVVWKMEGDIVRCDDLVKSLTAEERFRVARIIGREDTGWVVDQSDSGSIFQVY